MQNQKGKRQIKGRHYKVKNKTMKKIKKSVISGNDNLLGQGVPLLSNECPIQVQPQATGQQVCKYPLLCAKHTHGNNISEPLDIKMSRM